MNLDKASRIKSARSYNKRASSTMSRNNRLPCETQFLSFFAFAVLAFVLEWLGKMDKSEARNKEFLRHVGDIKGEIRRVTRLGRR